MIWLLAPPSGTDLSAQHFRAAFAAGHPGSIVDLSWLGGVQAPAYSVISPFVMAGLGVGVTGALAAIASAGLLAELLRRWSAPRLLAASVWGAVIFVLDLVDGRITFALGLAIGLAALLAVPAEGSMRWRWLPAVVLSILTGFASPVAALFLALTAFGWAISRRSLVVVIVASFVPLGVIDLLFPEPGHMPDAASTLRPDLIAALAVLLLCRFRQARLVALVYAVALLVIYWTTNPIGSNIERYSALFVGPALICCWRLPRVLLLVALCLAGWWSTEIPIRDLHASSSLQAQVKASHELVGDLGQVITSHGPLTGRVEVVPFKEHSESQVVAAAYPLARGWERQVDISRNSTVYDGTLTPARYFGWLKNNSVEYVALGRGPHDFGGAHEVKLLAHPPSYLTPVHVDGEWTIWRVQGFSPIVSSPGQLVSMDAASLTFSAPAAATVPVDVRWTRWWRASGGATVVKRGDLIAIRVPRAETVTLTSSY